MFEKHKKINTSTSKSVLEEFVTSKYDIDSVLGKVKIIFDRYNVCPNIVSIQEYKDFPKMIMMMKHWDDYSASPSADKDNPEFVKAFKACCEELTFIERNFLYAWCTGWLDYINYTLPNEEEDTKS